jgi:hypothetical protein
MSTQVSILNTSVDLKLKSSGKGGLSDGGIISYSQTLSASAPVVIAPPKGVNWGGLQLQAYGSAASDRGPGGVTAVNFDQSNDAIVEEYLVLEDGSEVLLFSHPVPAGTIVHVCRAFTSGLILSYPNKLKYKYVVDEDPLTARLLLKVALVEYDQPSA